MLVTAEGSRAEYRSIEFSVSSYGLTTLAFVSVCSLFASSGEGGGGVGGGEELAVCWTVLSYGMNTYCLK